ncbi:MAG: hypothetical protein A2W61_01435 [Deltaproteobacteria bacterium RIFCSPLOWO2_01_44_7]|nr:MAG: hypothetical protein A2712_04845 [Deltaproteobacteria bacterium RIFCSPHIGHO2_01_FULL_43_49]OGQ15957.1 MAG: hypothetical protein A3D22_07500 [Deltaproteobacteria bacterium RIFCSPHIGHO2_02_FULL_44_53]OGQ28899.1 MAG: hypothetical protein A3D98_05875 [Deltaproteobacteria bacterium RIFCSPHIGHO2_12_FULL_44_21]OGQ31013.1 MAG: hypothetical protein A2979_01895 [Deltaproteobacteria bacterium RIFCSPLOWO2_01_FULL_45_74]OGQ38842.1 MAG: hypothetical protein A2W61_01435 [Deltaproteobacteria bacterium 
MKKDSRPFDSAQGRPEAGDPRPKEPKLPPVDFTTFILSLASSVQVHLGLIANPATGKPEKNLELAKQTIDLLGLMEEKTKGNLTSDEGQILQHILHDLRIQFVEAKQ